MWTPRSHAPGTRRANLRFVRPPKGKENKPLPCPAYCEYTLRMLRVFPILAALLFAALPACRRSDAPPAAPILPPQRLVLVEVAPLISLVQPLVGEGVEVRAIVPVGTSPHGYQLSPGDARALASAAMVISIGPMLDPGIARAIERQTPSDRVFDLASALGIDAGDHTGHDHSHDDHDDHDEHCDHAVDPHLWLDPELMLRLVDLLPEALRSRGMAAEDADERARAVREEIAGVRDAYAQRLAPFAGRAIITHHNAFQRIADRYGLTVAQVVRPVAVVEPTPGDLSRVLDAATTHRVGAIFIEPQYPDALPRRIAAQLGLEIHTLNPEGSADWAGMMRENLDALVAGLSAPPPNTRRTPPNADNQGG
jgi:zinc transport system substrate-binding protein